MKNRGYYLSFSKDTQDGIDSISLEELRVLYARQTHEISELRQHNRSLSHTLWEVSRNPGKEDWLEERLTHQAIQIDKLQNANTVLTGKFERQRLRLNAVQLALKHVKQDKERLVQLSKLKGQLSDLEGAVNIAKKEVTDQVQLLDKSATKIDTIRTSIGAADKLLEERTEAIALIKQIKQLGIKRPIKPSQAEKPAPTEKPAEPVLQKAQNLQPIKATALEEAQAEIATLREAVRGYFFQFAGATGNRGAELDWLLKRAEKLSHLQSLPVNSEPLPFRPYSKSMQLYSMLSLNFQMNRLGLLAAALAALEHGETPPITRPTVATPSASAMYVLPDWFIRPWTDYYMGGEANPLRANGVYLLYREACVEGSSDEMIIGDFVYS